LRRGVRTRGCGTDGVTFHHRDRAAGLILRRHPDRANAAGYEAGLPLPTGRLVAVNTRLRSPAGGRDVSVINKIGWPDLVDTYWADFRVPDGTAGMTSLRLTAAWIPWLEFRFPVS
jgi:hypothetical protein